MANKIHNWTGTPIIGVQKCKTCGMLRIERIKESAKRISEYNYDLYIDTKSTVTTWPQACSAMKIDAGSPFEQDKKPTAMQRQIEGNHYKNMAIQPFEYAMKNKLNYGQANSIKYISRYKNKGGLKDLQKAIHTLQMLIELEYTAEDK